MQLLRSTSLAALLVVSTLLIRAQPSGNTAAFRHIPSDADAVYHIDLGALFSKASMAAIETPFLRPAGSQEKLDGMTAVLQQGVDLHRDLYLAVSNRYHPDSPKYITIIFPLTDAGKFIAYLHTQVRALRPLQQNGHDQVITSSECAVAWDQRQAIVVLRERARSNPGLYSIDVLREMNYRRAFAAWRGFPNAYFATDPDFKEAFSENADVHFWNRHNAGDPILDQVLRFIPNGAHLIPITRFFKDTSEHTIGILRFDTGRISYHQRRLTTRTTAAVITRLLSPPFDPELTAGAPFGKLLGAATLHFDPALLLDTARKLPEINKVGASFKTGGLTLQDIPNALKGDCLLLAYAPDQDPQGDGSIHMPDVYAVLRVRDTAAFRRLASFYKLTDATTALQVDTNFQTPFHYYALLNGIAVITTTPQMAQSYFAYSASASNPTGRLLSQRMLDGAISAGIDMGLLADFSTVMTKGQNDEMIARTRAFADVYRKIGVLTFSTGHVIGNAVEGDLEATLAGPDQNGLVVFLDIFKQLVAINAQILPIH